VSFAYFESQKMRDEARVWHSFYAHLSLWQGVPSLDAMARLKFQPCHGEGHLRKLSNRWCQCGIRKYQYGKPWHAMAQKCVT
jgi:hypothetical protein